jgi:alkylation response protein AidB-like acyl-CoA dehydrogenase
MYYSQRNLDFLLFELFDAPGLTRFPYYQDHDRSTFEMVMASARKIGDNHLLPIREEMDRKPPYLEDGRIKVHPGMRKVMEVFGEGGWISAHDSYENGGQQLPMMIYQAVTFILASANYSASVYPFLTTGAANLIKTFGSQALQDTYIPNMYAGKWQGTMALTEPDAGSSLSDLTTTASPQEDGTYTIKGQKIYISCGDHDACDNVIHLLLARIEGAPAGTKGISLFVVPRQRPEGDAWVDNDVTTAGMYHKMGYHGAPIAHLMLGEQDNCRGYLVGKPHHGLAYMFQMMNEARVGVGLTAVSIASAAYYASLAYARERPQGRPVGARDLKQAQVPIIQHPDVKRMLLAQKAFVEGSLALLLQCSYYADLAEVAEGAEKEKASLLLDLLTPVAKSFPSEYGCLSTSYAVQILGGAGYCQDFPVEQFYREARIHPIHEGTTGIHGLDLLGRKIHMKDTEVFEWFMEEVRNTIAEAREGHPELKENAEMLEGKLKRLRGATVFSAGRCPQGGPGPFPGGRQPVPRTFRLGCHGLAMATDGHQSL